MTKIQARAYARVGLLGNPSDLYAGRGLGFAVQDFPLDVVLTAVDGPAQHDDLVAAGWRVFERRAAQAGVTTTQPFTLTIKSQIPFQVGLSGSSAVLIAALRAWSRAYDVPLTQLEVAELAWRAEVDELGVRAGPLDRLVQAFQGLIAMDFSDPFAAHSIEVLDPASLPELLIAYDPDPGTPSGAVHEPVWERFQAGDAAVMRTMADLAGGATAGAAALAQADHGTFCDLVDRNFDLRASLFRIAPRDQAMIDLGRRHAAATKFCGSGGAVLVVPRAAGQLADLSARYEAAGFRTIVPTVALPSAC